MALNTIAQLIADFKLGKMVILMDDEDRENEGDLIMAAEKVEAQHINFMARYARGLICLTLTRERCKRLGLPLMVGNNTEQFATNFTVSIEAAEGVTTGISAADRAHTIRSAVSSSASPASIVQPGHIFPVMAEPGGVLTRAGHTEAGCDLARIAGLESAAAIVEILNEDGSMARRKELEVFAANHQLKIGTIADLIHYRTTTETTITRVSERDFSTHFGNFRLFAYRDQIDHQLHFALVKGKAKEGSQPVVRVHVEDKLQDILSGCGKSAGSWPLHCALERIAQAPHGVLVIIARQENSDELLKRLDQYQEADQWQPVPANAQNKTKVLRNVGIGSQILVDLGIRKMQLLSSTYIRYPVTGFDLEVTACIPFKPSNNFTKENL